MSQEEPNRGTGKNWFETIVGARSDGRLSPAR